MTGYDIPQTVKDASLKELVEIFRWLRARGEDERNPTTVLIGGWAVYTYNQWYGSVDIDLVTNNRTRQGLMWYLRSKRGFTPQARAQTQHAVIPAQAGIHSSGERGHGFPPARE